MDYARVEARIHEFLRERLDAADADGYVLGVSGGLDSALGARVAADAVGPENVLGLVLPGAPSSEANMRDARELCESRSIPYAEDDIRPAVASIREGLPGDFDETTVGNVRARVRMTYCYEAANAHDYLVLGADNRSEYELGYVTKYGDGAVDVAPFGDLYKTELYEFAEFLDLPEKFVDKQPTAELWEGQTDEGELGASYETIDAVLRRYLDHGLTVSEIVADTGIDRGLVERFVSLHESTEHKRRRPPTPGL
ncbi:NAD+ synthase [Salarchaeum sp. JOR-1]|uniref:NAD+ synthase n=1 Tax=Salarchaeum sp. JOR-1 TaxID=2599399 RepID=UPI001198C2D1|nr:NAD+ synthase [Salarchaeum sp. JOR-1]QDX39876.1 NAD+ synthase [Salarchaeum sp. JOR-1]